MRNGKNYFLLVFSEEEKAGQGRGRNKRLNFNSRKACTIAVDLPVIVLMKSKKKITVLPQIRWYLLWGQTEILLEIECAKSAKWN
jgi:hypothetical protein